MRKWFIAAVVAASLAYIVGWVIEGYTPADTAAGPPDTIPGAVRVVAAGDIACPAGNLPTPVQCQQGATAAIARDFNPQAVLLLGDVQYQYGGLADFRGSFDKSWGMFGDALKPAPGNHEWLSGNADGYFQYFGSRAGPDERGYYSFDLGGWHLISLDSDCYWSTAGCGPSSAQYQWLESDLKAHPSQCTLAYWHHPVFTSGEYRLAVDQRAAGRYFYDLIYQYHGDLILNGHDHIYERFAHLNPSGQLDDAGPRQITAGSGGRSHSTHGAPISGSEFIDAHHFGVLELNLGLGEYTWNFVDTSGRTIDSGTDRCHAALL